MLRVARLRRLVLLLRWRLCLVARVVLRHFNCQLARWALLRCSVVRLRRLLLRQRRRRLVRLVRAWMMRQRWRALWRVWPCHREVATRRRRVMRQRLRRRRREAHRVRRRLHLSRHRLWLTRGKWGTISRLALAVPRVTIAAFVSWRTRF